LGHEDVGAADMLAARKTDVGILGKSEFFKSFLQKVLGSLSRAARTDFFPIAGAKSVYMY
jgi:hypothetical protein